MDRRRIMAAVMLLWCGIPSPCSGIPTTKIRLYNKCPFTVWPAWMPTEGFSQEGSGGAQLGPFQSHDFFVTGTWAGRFWGRTSCTFNSDGNGACQTGDCLGQFSCKTMTVSPVTLVEFLPLQDQRYRDHYHVSLLHGYNLPLQVIPKNRACSVAGCNPNHDHDRDHDLDLRHLCPPELRILDSNHNTIACNSACDAFNIDRYCCNTRPVLCLPHIYSALFKSSCPFSLTYPHDFLNSSFICSSGSDYTITFCPD